MSFSPGTRCAWAGEGIRDGGRRRLHKILWWKKRAWDRHKGSCRRRWCDDIKLDFRSSILPTWQYFGRDHRSQTDPTSKHKNTNDRVITQVTRGEATKRGFSCAFQEVKKPLKFCLFAFLRNIERITMHSGNIAFGQDVHLLALVVRADRCRTEWRRRRRWKASNSNRVRFCCFLRGASKRKGMVCCFFHQNSTYTSMSIYLR